MNNTRRTAVAAMLSALAFAAQAVAAPVSGPTEPIDDEPVSVDTTPKPIVNPQGNVETQLNMQAIHRGLMQGVREAPMPGKKPAEAAPANDQPKPAEAGLGQLGGGLVRPIDLREQMEALRRMNRNADPLDRNQQAAPSDKQIDKMLSDAVGLMGSVEQGLTAERTGKTLQKDQERIVSMLDEIIEALDMQCSQCSGGGSGTGAGSNTANPSKPMEDSQLASGPGGVGELRDKDESRNMFADLPEEDRERILQAENEGFPPGYEKALEAFYKRLAQGGGEPATDSRSDDAPAEPAAEVSP